MHHDECISIVVWEENPLRLTLCRETTDLLRGEGQGSERAID